MSPKKLTEEDLAGEQFRNVMHMNLGGGSYGYAYQSTIYPRIGFRHYGYKGAMAKKKGCSHETIWTLDGVQVESQQAAMDGHATPPEISDEERKVFDLVPAEWAPYRETEDAIDKALGLAKNPLGGNAPSCYPIMHTLSAKGLIETKREPCEPKTGLQKDPLFAHLNYTTMVRRRPDDAVV